MIKFFTFREKIHTHICRDNGNNNSKTEILVLDKAKGSLSLRIPAKAGIWYIASSAIARSVGVMGTPIFTRLLTPSEYGIYPLYNTWLGVAGVIVTLELTGGVIYRGLQKYADRKDEFISSVFGLFLTIFTSICALYFPFSAFINRITGLNTRITVLMLLQIFANTVISLYTAKARYEYRYKSAAMLNIISAFGIPMVSVLLVLLTDLAGEGRIYGSCAVLVTMAIPLLFILLKRSKKIFNGGIWRFLLKFNLPLLPHYFAMSMILRIGEITVGRCFGTTALGRYSVAISLGMSLTVVTNGILSALSPWMLRKIKSHGMDEIRDLLLILAKGLSVLALIFLSFSPEVIKILTPEDFHSALPAVYPLLISVVPMFLSSALMSGEMYYEKNTVSSLPSIAAALVSILLTLLILPRTDYRVVSLFVFSAYTVLLMLNALIFKRLSGEYPIHIKKTVITALLSIFYAAVLFMFRDYLQSRIVLMLPLLPILFVIGRQAWERIRE